MTAAADGCCQRSASEHAGFALAGEFERWRRGTTLQGDNCWLIVATTS
jgi:hypothetical protein